MEAETGTASRKAEVSRSLAKAALSRWDIVLVLILLLAAVPRLYLGAVDAVNYDGYWHVLIAQQDQPENFWGEVHRNAHPPLYYVLLKIALVFGRSPLIYRSISILAGIAAVFLVWKILEKTVRLRFSPALGALAFGLAVPAIVVSCEVRAYMLCAFFILLSFYYFLDVIGPYDRLRLKARVLFAVSASLACLTHYSAFFYVAASLGVAIVSAFIWRGSSVRKAAVAHIAMFLPVVGVSAALYSWHAGLNAVIQQHLLPFYLLPDSPETVDQFLRRNFKTLLGVLGPFPVVSRAAYRTALLLIGAGGLLYMFFVRRLRDSRNAGAAAVGAVGVLMLVEIMFAGVLGKYPFGGDLRQQFILFPFVVLAAVILFDRISDALPSKWAPVALSMAALAVIAVSAVRFAAVPITETPVLASEMQRYSKLVPNARAVYVDQFNLVAYFTYHDDWKWTFAGRDPSLPHIDTYRLTHGNESILLFRDMNRWNLDYADPGIYEDLARCLRSKNLPALTVFCVRQSASNEDGAQLRKRVYELAQTGGICVQKLNVTPSNMFGEFRQSGCLSEPGQKPASGIAGLFDDRAGEVEYAGKWLVNDFPHAAERTLSCSSDPNARARFSFFGTSFVYIYTRAWNRGFADIYIDGEKKARIDQYKPGPEIGWQTRREFSGLSEGRHTVEVRVTGERVPAATDWQIDVDGFVVR